MRSPPGAWPPLAFALALAGAGGCFAPDIADGVIACGAAGCPDGMSCAGDGLCYHEPPGGDAPDAGIGPVDPIACQPAAPVDPCTALPPLPGPPAIDGELDCGPTLSAVPTDHWHGSGRSTPKQHAADIAVAWRPNGIYIYAQVRDPNVYPAQPGAPVWVGDGVEIYLDDDGRFASPPLYDDPGTRQIVVAAPEGQAAEHRAEIYVDTQPRGAWSSSAFVAVPTPDGFTVEAFVATGDLGTPGRVLAGGEDIGLNVAINLARDEHRGNDQYLGQYFLHLAKGAERTYPYDDVAAFCLPTLAPR